MRDRLMRKANGTEVRHRQVVPPIESAAVADEAADRRYRRIWGALAGLAYGDAQGQPFVFYRPAQVTEVYGADPDWPVPVPAAPGRRCWMRYEASDDTFQSLCVAQSLISRQRLDTEDIAARLAALPGRYASAQSAIHDLRARRRGGDVRMASLGAGAAMRIAPVALAFANNDLPGLVAAVAAASRISHTARSTISGAAAAAAFVRAMLRDDDVTAGVRQALEASALAAPYGEEDGAPPLHEAISRALEHCDDLESLLPADIDACKDVTYVVPIAFAVIWRHRHTMSLPDAVLDAVRIGADADTQGAIVGYMAGSANPASVPYDVIGLIEDRNAFRLSETAVALWRMTLCPSDGSDRWV
ncbi:ADP-ribosylglycohydrolase family protein [Nonomuraea helvata]|uniref:ADP-ribosylglycohydrolase family protein n=1 Tax=Nonomuraea helvata TaxID=37484 RepID=A0ABV5SAD7_9ACTN